MSTSFDPTQASSGRSSARSWVREAEHRGGLSRYVQVTKDHWRLMLILVGLVLGAALLAVAVSSKEYKAEALLSVSPVSTDDPRFEGINVIRVTSVPGRDVETLARLVKTIPVARAAAATDGVGGDPNALLSRITVSPVGGSFLVSVSASAPTGEEAAALANAFAQGTIAVRSAAFREQVESRIDAVNAQLSSSVLGAGTRTQLNTRLDQLQALRASDDPSIQLETLATVPESPDAPPLPLIIAIALVVGGIVAFAGAVAVDTASSRVRTEGQLSERFNLPVLARVPKPAAGPAAMADAYRDLAQSIAVARKDPDRPRALLFTSAGDDEGCTTAAVEAARTLADAGQRVLLVDADLRQPTIARGFNLTPRHGTGSVLLGDVPLERAVQDVPGFRGALAVIGGDDEDSAAAAVSLSPAQVTRLVTAATGHADFVIFDGAPLGTVADAAPVANAVDDVVIVVRRGETELSRLNRLTETLLRYDVAPSGLCLVDWSQHASERAAGGSLHRGDKAEERAPRAARPGRERARNRDEGRAPRREPAVAEAGDARRQEAAAAPVLERPAPEAERPAPPRPEPVALRTEESDLTPRPSLREVRQQIEEARAADLAREEAAQVVAPPEAVRPEPSVTSLPGDAALRVTEITSVPEPVTEVVAPEPVAEGLDEPVASEPEPVAEVVAPEPVTEVVEPEPVLEVEEPLVSEPEPVAEVEEPEPVAEVEEPVASEPEPVTEVEEPEPVAEAVEPEVEETEPVAEVVEPEPVAEVEEPVASEPEPVLEVEEPVTEVAEPVEAEVLEPEPVPEVEEPVAEEPVAEPEPELAVEDAEPEAVEPEAAADADAGDDVEDVADEDGDDGEATANGGNGTASASRPRPASRTARNPRRRKTPPRR